MIIGLIASGIIASESVKIDNVCREVYLKADRTVHQVNEKEKFWDYAGEMRVSVMGLSGTAFAISNTSSSPYISIPIIGSFS